MKRPEELLARGLITGLFGAAAVALWFFFLDFSDGHPFRTPAALGSALLFGITGVETMKITFGIVAAYTLVHVVAFVVAGTIFVWIAEQVERSSSLVLLTIPAAIALEAVVVTGLAQGAEWVLGTLVGAVREPIRRARDGRVHLAHASEAPARPGRGEGRRTDPRSIGIPDALVVRACRAATTARQARPRPA
jgi:hypothetical protein